MGHQNNNILTKNTLKQYTLNTLKIAVIEMKGFLEVQVRAFVFKGRQFVFGINK